MAADHDWRDGASRDEVKDYAEYIAHVTKSFVEALEKEGFTHQEAIQLAAALVPMGAARGH